MAWGAARPCRHALSGPQRHGVFRQSNPLASGFRAGRVNGKTAEIARRDLIRLAEEHDVGNAPAIIGRVIDSVGRWMEHAAARAIPRTTAAMTAAMTAAQHRLSI
ncbi:MAG: hypothetical protein ACO3JG_02735 [Luteolibacter sp.]